MIGAALRGLKESLHPFGPVLREPNLRRVELAWTGSMLALWLFAIPLGVYAYERGGPAAVGVMGLVRMLPPTLASPFVAVLADRFPREQVMLVTDLIRVVALVALALIVMGEGPLWAVYVLTAFVAVVSTAFKPAEAALLPRLAPREETLGAANAVTTTIESVGTLVGPGLAGLLLVVASPGVALLACAGALLWSAFNVVRIRVPRQAAAAAPVPATDERPLEVFLSGFRVLWTHRDLRLIAALIAAQTLVLGALEVLIYTLAFRVFETGEGGAGFLLALLGAGGLLGAVVIGGLMARGRLLPALAVGLLLVGAPLIVLGLLPLLPVAVAVLLAVGVGNTLSDVAGVTLTQRLCPDEVRGRVFGVLESVITGPIGLGAVLAPLLIAALGTGGALIVVGCLLPLIVGVLWARIASVGGAGNLAGGGVVRL